MDRITLRSPAKLNLFLKVLGKNPDGYHKIETVFEKIDLCDRIILTKQKRGIKVISSNPNLPDDETNLAYKAAALLLKKTRSSSGVAIEIKKNIPLAAGLGGGSSNAASVLLGLNKLYGFGLRTKELLTLAKNLGADVAFFIHECSFAKGTARGDRISPIKADLKLWQVLVIPSFGLSTKDVYEALGKLKKTKLTGSKAVIDALRNKDLTGLNGLLYNSLEEVVLSRHSEISRIKQYLRNIGIEGALVSGSGSAIFGLAKTRKEAMNTEANLRKNILADKKKWQVYVVHTI